MSSENTRRAAMRRMHLPMKLNVWIREGRLASEVASAQASLTATNAFLDMWEERYPAAAALAPWAPARAAWKAAGRQPPNWLEVLYWYEQQSQHVPVTENAIGKDLLLLHRDACNRAKKRWQAKKAAQARADAPTDTR